MLRLFVLILYYCRLYSISLHTGEVNKGKMHWGLKQCNDSRHHVPTVLLSILSGCECMATYRGTHKQYFESCMSSFNDDVYDHFGPQHPLLMTQELYGQYDTTLTHTHKSTRDRKRKQNRQIAREDGVNRRSLHSELVRDQCSVNDGIDLHKPVKDIIQTVISSSPNTLNKIQQKELRGRSRKSLLRVVKKQLLM